MTVDMEVEFLNLGLDIIGLGVFNYEFGSITTESPVIKVLLSATAAVQCTSPRIAQSPSACQFYSVLQAGFAG
jgi:hypothetical protein